MKFNGNTLVRLQCLPWLRVEIDYLPIEDAYFPCAVPSHSLWDIILGRRHADVPQNMPIIATQNQKSVKFCHQLSLSSQFLSF